jgi:hypothetical protein
MKKFVMLVVLVSMFFFSASAEIQSMNITIFGMD